VTEREPYEPPQVREQSVEEMLTEAQQAVDQTFEAYHRAEAKVGDLGAVLDSISQDLEALQEALTDAEHKVQRVAYVAKVKGEHDEDQPG
jgi:chromosome segregation ATPase